LADFFFDFFWGDFLFFMGILKELIVTASSS